MIDRTRCRFVKISVRVQPNGWRLGMSCRTRHLGFKFPLRAPLNYLIHDFDGWGCVSVVYSPGVGPKGLFLVRFHVIKKRKKDIGFFIFYYKYSSYSFSLIQARN